jgi:hypothetical protein
MWFSLGLPDWVTKHLARGTWERQTGFRDDARQAHQFCVRPLHVWLVWSGRACYLLDEWDSCFFFLNHLAILPVISLSLLPYCIANCLTKVPFPSSPSFSIPSVRLGRTSLSCISSLDPLHQQRPSHHLHYPPDNPVRLIWGLTELAGPRSSISLSRHQVLEISQLPLLLIFIELCFHHS